MSEESHLLFDELKTASQQILETLSEIIGVNTLFVAVNDSKTNFILKAFNRLEKLAEEGTTPFFETYCSLVFQQEDDVLVIPETTSHSLTKTMNVTSEVGNTLFIGIPIKLRDGTNVGTICGMDRNVYTFSKTEVDLMKSMATLLSYVIELENMAFRDSLTQVFNRHYLDLYFDNEIKNTHGQIGFLFFDFDNFKGVNDTYNHYVGDQVLKGVTDKIKQHLRQDDILCRIGGDEFLALVFDYERDEVLAQIIDQVQQSLHEPVETTVGQITVSTSIGVSRYPKDGTEIHDLVKKADRAMYKVKENGKNDFLFYALNSL